MPATTRPGDSGTHAAVPKPPDQQLDFYGLTHPGRVRPENQDHFLICTLHKSVRVLSTSLPNRELLELPSQRIASFSMVADGVGGLSGGETASRAALEAVASYLTNSMQCFYTADPDREDAFFDALNAAAQATHEAVRRRAEETGQREGMATTLTLAIALWPALYILQVGDSRAYRLRDGALTQLTRDQTMAQDLVDSGLLPEAKKARSPFAHVLSSSIGGHSQPAVTRVELAPGDVTLLCTDGLTKHVPDERIRERLSEPGTSRERCGRLLEDALAAGGTDNVTVVVLRLREDR